MISATECRQLLKLPVLVEHFTEHKQLNNGISFWDFIEMHYLGHDLNDNDQDRDMQLPFKSHNDSPFFILKFSDCKVFHHTFAAVEPPQHAIIPSAENDFESAYLSSIWQPPKSC